MHPSLPPSLTSLRLAAGQVLTVSARAGTWLQVEQGVLTVQGPPRWLGGCMVAPVRRLTRGEGLALEDDGVWQISAEGAPVRCHCVVPELRPALSTAGLAKWHSLMRRVLSAWKRSGPAAASR